MGISRWTKAFEHGCGESFRKMSANASARGSSDEICEIAKNGWVMGRMEEIV